jgi:hypothetical protein
MPTEAAFKPYERQLKKWLPKAHVQAKTDTSDAVVRCRCAQKTITYGIELKANLEHQDVWAVVEQLRRYRQRTVRHAPTRLMVLAPFIRREQGAVLEEYDIDYIDLAGNAHLRVPGVFVHVEGLRLAAKPRRTQGRMTRGWAKTVLALLVRPDIIQQPYRPIAEIADVAPATVMTCLAHLKAAGFVRREGHTRHLTNTRDLLALWVQAYIDVLRPKLVQRSFQMKVVNKTERWHRLRDVLAKRNIRWALTGADAALLTDPHLRTDQTEIYGAPERFDEPDLLRELQMQPAVTGNLQVIEPPAPIALQGDIIRPEAPVAPLLLVYAELRHRNNDQANEAAELLLPQVFERATA